MDTRAAVGVLQKDGRILAACVSQDGGRGLAGLLLEHYGTRNRATMLVSLGSIMSVGETPADCTLPAQEADPELLDMHGFERMRAADLRDFHLFDESGSWVHWTDEEIVLLEIAIEEE